MLNYDMPLYRPPSEGDNLIIQATLGCSFNQCSFCSMYKTKDYRPRDLADVFADIDQAARVWPEAHRIFLADGDALTLPMDSLRAILDKLHATFPNLNRVSAYATPGNILKKTSEELVELRERKMPLFYVGIESGAPVMLKKITKGASQKGIAESLIKAREAGLKISATVILGLGGQKYWEEHIDGTVDLLSQAPVTYLSTLQLYLEEIAYDEFMKKFGEPFEAQGDMAVLAELERLLANLKPPAPVIFRSNHASNALALAGNLPKDQARLLAEVQGAMAGSNAIRPRFMRRL
ncbi:Radical SAM domain protein [Candidatus Terasakiella magnetica]|uniref:Radical SAM domain protein n=1 Tax=Candidatus Terasakiella magnetica TaxID=1867952 RepID=A0A1C3RFD7_9PROT|nr:radical SAM protein [Candidatus Terasakiella magnetica]SCA55965.1 Radical SAM domain protein [Candidatus Terasakiella magnetica]